MIKQVALSLTFTASAVFAQAPEPAATQPDFSLTVYSTADPATFDPQEWAEQQLNNPYNRPTPPPGYGVVREVRKIDLQSGENELRFTDVARAIDPTTVSFLSLTDPAGTSVLEQNYEYDVVNGYKLLEKYKDKDVSIATKGSGSSSSSVVSGRLLASDFNEVVIGLANGQTVILQRQEIAQITLQKLDTSLVTKPTLIWKINSDKAGPQRALVSYQTDGITWRADYSVVLNATDDAADVGAWVTLVNQCGASFPDAKLKLVAGDVRRIKQPPQQQQAQQQLFGGTAAKDAGFKEKAFFEYHLYTLGRPSSVMDNASKQIELFPTHADVPIDKTYVYYGRPTYDEDYGDSPNTDRNLGSKSNKNVDVYLLLTNSEQNSLGIPLPAGRVRVYKKDDADNSLEFIGEDVIQHTPKDEKLMVRIGSAFDIVGERKQTDFKSDEPKWITESFQIQLRNHKAQPVHVIVKENLYRWSNWQITESSDKWDKQDSRTIHFPVDLHADGSKTITYTVKYTW